MRFSCGFGVSLFVCGRLLAAPANDNFANATSISGSAGSTTGNNTEASVEAGEPPHASLPASRSIWYRWTPPVRERYQFATTGSSFDTTMAAYAGSSVGQLTDLAHNDDIDGGNSTSRIEFTGNAGTSYSIAVDGYPGESGSVNLSWGLAPLSNDNFSSARTIVGRYGTASGFNFRATAQSGEPSPGTSVWFRWTAPSTMNALFRTEGSDFDTVLGVYTGGSVTGLTQVALDDNGGPNGTSRLTFAAAAGTTYRIMVRGAGAGALGDIVLTWGESGGENTELLPDVTVLADQANQYLYGWTIDQEEIPDRTLMRLTTATPNTGAGPLELRGSSANPAVYQRIYRADGSFQDRLAGTFTFHPTHGHLHLEDWIQFHLRSVLAGNAVGPIVAAGEKTSFAIMDLEPHNPGLPGAPASGVYHEGLLQGISVGWRDVYDQTLDDQWIDVTALAPGQYYLEGVVDPDDHLKESDETNNVTRVLITYNGTVPPNNSFANAVTLTGTTAGVTGRNIQATKQSGEPAHAGNAGGASVWYQWTAPAAGPVTVTTQGSSFDTLLGIYTGSAVNSLTTVTSNNDADGVTTSRVTFTAGAGTIYRIAVDGKSAATGSVQLAINPGSNDAFAAAVPLATAAGSASGSNRQATAQGLEPAHGGSAASRSIWYAWTAPQNGDAVFDTEGSSFDATLAIYTGSSIGGLTPVAAATSNGPANPSRLIFPATQGTTYRVAIDGSGGIVALNWQVSASIAPFFINQPASFNAIAGATITIAAVAGGSAPLEYQWRFRGQPLADGGKISGAHSSVLTVRKLTPAEGGAYSVVVTNGSGTATSLNATILVIDNPRIVYAHDAPGDIGGKVFLPIHIQSQGNEHAVNFSLTFDPAVFGTPQVQAGADSGGASITLDQSLTAGGALGVSVALPTSQVLSSGVREIAMLSFEVVPSAPAGAVLPVAFDNVPVVRNAFAAGGNILPAVFAPGNVTLGVVQPSVRSSVQPDGSLELTVCGLRGRTYTLQGSTNLGTWAPIESAVIGPSGEVGFTVPPAASLKRRFFRATLAP